VLANVKFTLRGESEMMAAILDRHEQPDIAAAEWLKANPTATKAWLEGVLTFDGKPAYLALAHAIPPPRPGGFEQWIVSHKIPVGDAMAVAIETIKTHGTFVFDGISIVIRGMVNGATAGLRLLPAPLLIIAIVVLAYVLRRSWTLGLRRAGAAVHTQSGLLGRDARDLEFGVGRHFRVRRHRRSRGHRRRASAAAVCGASAGARFDADAAHLRVL
jgi:hypothetical protein